MSVVDDKKSILDEVFKELRIILRDLQTMQYEDFTHTEQAFIAILGDALKHDTYSYNQFLAKLTENELNVFYNNVKAFVIEFSTRIHMNTAERLDETGTKGTSIGQTTVSIDLGLWIYIGNGRFKAKKDAMLRLLNEYVGHQGLTWKDHRDIFDIEGNKRNIEDYDLIYPGEEVQFGEEAIHGIEEKLTELDYEMKSPVDLLKFKCTKEHDEKMGGNTRVIYRMDNTFEYWIDKDNELAGWSPDSFQKFFGYADFYDPLAHPIFRFKIGEIRLDMGAYTVRLWHGDYGNISNEVILLKGMADMGLGAETGVYNSSSAEKNGVADGKIRDNAGKELKIPTGLLNILDSIDNSLDNIEVSKVTCEDSCIQEKISELDDEIEALKSTGMPSDILDAAIEIRDVLKNNPENSCTSIQHKIRDARDDMLTDWGHSLSNEELVGHGITEITTELWVLEDGYHKLIGAVTEEGNWPNLYSLDSKGHELAVDSAHIFRFDDDKKAGAFFNTAKASLELAGLENELKASIVGNGMYVRLDWFD